MSEQQSSYRQVVKATSIFGGVQVFNIIISIIRSKFIAVLLGPAGMGISDLLISTSGLISGITNFGLGTSAVRDVAAANSTGNKKRISIIIIVLKRWIYITSTLGAVIMLVLSPWLSQVVFGNHHYTIAFVWISITFIFNQITSGQLVILQGMRKMEYLAKASLAGSALGLIITVPLYYKFGTEGIVPAIIITSIISFSLSWYYGRQVKIEKLHVTRVRTIAEGKHMLMMGFLISLSGLISLGASYVMRIFISRHGGIEQVGFYTAGFAMINTYVGLVFTAMATDYYPRLSAVAHSNELCKRSINQQAEIALLILAPVIMVFIIFIKWLVILLYSSRFIAVNDMIIWAALGMFFKAATWSIGFILLAKGASKIYFWCEFTGNLYMLALNIIGYHFLGLTGLGISFLAGYLVYFIQVFILSWIKYQFRFDIAFIKIFIIQFALAVGCFLAVRIAGNAYAYISGVVLIGAATRYSYYELDKRLDLKEIILNLKSGKGLK